jgi:signal transduction histidine kinase
MKEAPDELLADLGPMGALMRTTDWSRTPLGPIESWPRSLISYVAMILEMPSPAIIFWGPEQTQIYNEGYALIMGPRHPRYFGAPYRDCWPDTYPMIYPWMRKVLDHGEIIRVDKEHIPVTRYGFLEDAYFSFTFSALRDDRGTIAGIFQPVFEVTATVLSERRAETLRALTPQGDSLEPVEHALGVLSGNPADVPFAAVYLAEEAAEGLELVGYSANLGGCDACFDAFAQAASQAFRSQEAAHIKGVDRLVGGARGCPWPEPPTSALVLPIGRSAKGVPRGAIVFGISPRLHFDEKYRSFLELAAAQVAAAIGRMRVRQAAERQRQYLNGLFLQAPAAIAIFSGPEHVFELVNPPYRQFIGARDVVGMPIRQALPELADQPFCDILDSVYRTGEAYVGREVPTRVDRRGDGATEEVYFNFVYQPMRDAQGEVEGILAFAFEVTDQVEARHYVEALTEELKREHQLKDEFLAMLAHELRNPLAAAANAVELLAASSPAEPASGRPIDVLRRQTQVLKGLVDDLLDVSRITRGLVELKRETVDLCAIAKHALESVQAQLQAKAHALHVSLPPEPLWVQGDSVRLEQVLVNLLTNAAKYTDRDGRIALSAAVTGDSVQIRVTDNGIGMAPEVLGRIFLLFGQAERGLDRAEGGLGIGLTIAKSLVELHGGRIEAHSEGRGKGSEFTVTLPLAGAPAVSQTHEAPGEPREGCRKRVLVVDDSKDIADTLALLLTDSGHEVAVAYDGPAALAKAEAMQPEVILLDIGLPGMNGYEVAQQLRDNPRTRGTVLAALSGYGQPSDRERTRAAGFDRHFVKPVDLDVLEAFVNDPQGRS